MSRTWLKAAVASVLLLAVAQDGNAWTGEIHREIVRKAADVLPKNIKSFYKKRRNVIMDLVADPARGRRRLVFEVDRLESFPFDGLPLTREAAVQKYGEELLNEAGDLPWRVVERYDKLVEAFRNLDVEQVQAISADVAYLVADLHVPTSLSKDGDGGPTQQNGLRERFDSRLLELYFDKVDIDPETAIYLDKPAEYVLSLVRRTYVWVDNILLSDYMAAKGVSSYDRYYYDMLWKRESSLLRKLLSESAEDAGSYWYTAWVSAGKPKLPKE